VTAPLVAQCYVLTGLKLGLAFGIAMPESRIGAQTMRFRLPDYKF